MIMTKTIIILVFTVLSVGFSYFTNVVQLLCSLSGRLHLNGSSISTGFMAVARMFSVVGQVL